MRQVVQLADNPTLEIAEKMSGVLASRVVARRKIFQSPLCNDPDVPKLTEGIIVDKDYFDNHIYVDFGTVYGVVLCDYCELM